MSDRVFYHLGGFPPSNIDWGSLVTLIGDARAALAHYDGLLSAVPNSYVLLSPLTTQEAVLSSKIEGTNVTVGEVLEIEAGSDTEEVTQPKRDDAEEIVNYRIALRFAAQSLADRPLSQHLLREAHALLLRGVRGLEMKPGSFRAEQNWIGPRDCTVEEASFVPIPQEHLHSGLDAWASYIRSQERDPLVQLAITHLEFEAIHPFMDGNGRLGRMIIPLFLYERKLLQGPYFYMSGYLEAHREQYVDAMRAVSRDGAWTEWCAFFLRGIVEQASENQKRAEAILNLHQRMLHEVAELTHSQHSARAVECLFSSPIFSSTYFVDNSDVPRPTALRILSVLKDAGIIITFREGVGRRAAIYTFPMLLQIVE